MELGANRMIETEVLGGDISLSSFEEIIFKGELKHKIIHDRMRGVRWVKRYTSNMGHEANEIKMKERYKLTNVAYREV